MNHLSTSQSPKASANTAANTADNTAASLAPTTSTPSPATAVPLAQLARVVRSKNAGPTCLTIDLFFPDAQAYARAAASEALQAPAVAARYGVTSGQVRRFELPDIFALKLSLPRRRCAGDPGDGDCYGAQQHVPLLVVML